MRFRNFFTSVAFDDPNIPNSFLFLFANCHLCVIFRHLVNVKFEVL